MSPLLAGWSSFMDEAQVNWRLCVGVVSIRGIIMGGSGGGGGSSDQQKGSDEMGV